MLHCSVCDSDSVTVEFVNEVFDIGGTLIVVEHIPANVCATCGDITYSRETTENIRHLVHGDRMPARLTELAVYEYA